MQLSWTSAKDSERSEEGEQRMTCESTAHPPQETAEEQNLDEIPNQSTPPPSQEPQTQETSNPHYQTS